MWATHGVFLTKFFYRTTACAYSATGCRATPSWRLGIFFNRIPLQNNSLRIFCHWLQGHPTVSWRLGVFLTKFFYRTTACAYSATGCRATPLWGTSFWSALSFPPPCSPVRTPFAQALQLTRSDTNICFLKGMALRFSCMFFLYWSHPKLNEGTFRLFVFQFLPGTQHFDHSCRPTSALCVF